MMGINFVKRHLIPKTNVRRRAAEKEQKIQQNFYVVSRGMRRSDIVFKQIEQFLFYFLFFAIPFQTRKILYYPGWYYNEWQSVSIYATDVLLMVLFLFWAYRSIQGWKISNFQFLISKQLSNHLITKLPKHDLFLLSFLLAAGISVKNSSDFYVGVFLWLKLVEFALLYFYLKAYAIRKFNFISMLYALILGGVFQAVVGIGQFLKQGDLGLRWFGESVLGPHMTGVASFLVGLGLPAEALAKAGEKIMRAYGTTPHPNILAAYLFLAVFAFYFLWLYQKQNTAGRLSVRQLGWLLAVGYPVLLFGLFFTFSRTIIFLFFFNFFARGFLINFIKRFKTEFLTKSFIKQKILPIFLVTIAVTALFASLYWPEILSRLAISSEEEAVRLRVFYNRESLSGGLNLFGIGPGDFTGWLMEQNPNLPSHVYQPVHNIYLLVYSEIGVLGFVFFLLFLAGLFYEFIKRTKLSKLRNYSFLLVAASILFIGLFDHFLLTLQQGRFVFWIGLTILSIGDIMRTQGGDGAT